MLGWDRRRTQLLQEIETHIEMETQQSIEAGIPPEQARHAARKRFGNVLFIMSRLKRQRRVSRILEEKR
jgi:hypothetical protein